MEADGNNPVRVSSRFAAFQVSLFPARVSLDHPFLSISIPSPLSLLILLYFPSFVSTPTIPEFMKGYTACVCFLRNPFPVPLSLPPELTLKLPLLPSAH